MTHPPNIVIIMADQWRGDCLSALGHPIVETPYLDKMTTEGITFTNAYSTTPTCIAARAALFTGLKPRSHGRVGYQDGVPWNYPVTLAGEFTKHGYQTQAVGKMHVYPERSQLGFQNVVLHDGYLHFARNQHRELGQIDDYIPWLREKLGPHADYLDHGVDCNANVARPWDKPEYTHPTTWVVSQSIEFLRKRDPRKPFMLFMSFHRPHPPYDPPQAYWDQYINREMPAPPIGDWEHIFDPYEDSWNPNALVAELSPNRLQRARAGYYGHMSHIDSQLQRFFEVLREYSLYDNTWFLFTADHGELMGDHRLFRKSFPYEGSAHIPMILKPPVNSELTKHFQVEQPVCLRDVMPTLLDAAQLPVPDSLEGQSMLNLVLEKNQPSRTLLQGEHTIFGQSVMYVTDGHQKFVWFSGNGHEQFFDLEEDPQELHDCIDEPRYQNQIELFRQHLIHELTGREEGFTDGETLIPGRPVNPVLRFLREQS